MNSPRRFAWVALLGVPIAFFFVSKRATQQRPWLLATVPKCDVVRFSPDSRILVATSGPSSLDNNWYLFFDVQTKKLLERRKVLDYALQTPPFFSPDGTKTVCALGYIWNSPPPKSPFEFLTPNLSVKEVASQKEKSISDTDMHQEDEGDEPTVQSAVWTSDGRELVVAGHRQVRRFDAQSGKLLSRAVFRALPKLRKGELPVIADGEQRVAISPNGKQFIYIESPWLLTIRDTKTAVVQASVGTKNPPYDSANLDFPYFPYGWSAKGNFIWVEDAYAPAVKIFDASSRRLLWAWKGLYATVGMGATDYHLSPDEKSIVACNGASCIARALKTGKELWRVKNPNSPVFALSPDGKTLAEVRSGGKIFLWPLHQSS